VQQYLLLLISTNLIIALLVILVFLINLAANKQINKDKKQFAVFVPQHFSKQFSACYLGVGMTPHVKLNTPILAH